MFYAGGGTEKLVHQIHMRGERDGESRDPHIFSLSYPFSSHCLSPVQLCHHQTQYPFLNVGFNQAKEIFPHPSSPCSLESPRLLEESSRVSCTHGECVSRSRFVFFTLAIHDFSTSFPRFLSSHAISCIESWRSYLIYVPNYILFYSVCILYH